MPQLNISDKFVAACSPVIDTNYATHGTITKSSIDHLTPSDLNNLYQPGGLFADMDAWFHHSIEMKACGVRVEAWYDWIMANSDREGGAYRAAYRNAIMSGSKVAKGIGLLEPFIKGKQVSVVNRDHWKMENSIKIADYNAGQAGTALGTMTAGPLASTSGGTAVIRVTPRHNIPVSADWFRPAQVIYVFTLTTGIAQQGNWKVVDAEVNTALTYIDVLVTSENGGSAGAFFNVATTGASAKAGLIIPGINNVNDFEKWCNNKPNLDPRKMVPFWYQTKRMARRIDSEYEAVFARLMESNEAFRQFGDLDMAQRNAQDELDEQKAFVNAFFFQKPISADQTLANWESLAAIDTVTEVDLKPGLGGKIQARRANFVGALEQLRACDRVFDLRGNTLNLDEFFKLNYDIYKARVDQGRNVTRIDWHTNCYFQDWFHRGMLTYYKAISDDTMRWVVNSSEVNDLGMTFNTYKSLTYAGFEISIISSRFFNDWYDENNAVGNGAAANLLLCLDIGKPGPNGGTIYWAPMAMNRKTYKTATIEEMARLDATFRCVMAINSESVTLTSETGAVIVECPLNSAWVHNIGMAKPLFDTGAVYDSYGSADLY